MKNKLIGFFVILTLIASIPVMGFAADNTDPFSPQPIKYYTTNK